MLAALVSNVYYVYLAVRDPQVFLQLKSDSSKVIQYKCLQYIMSQLYV